MPLDDAELHPLHPTTARTGLQPTDTSVLLEMVAVEVADRIAAGEVARDLLVHLQGEAGLVIDSIQVWHQVVDDVVMARTMEGAVGAEVGLVFVPVLRGVSIGSCRRGSPPSPALF